MEEKLASTTLSRRNVVEAVATYLKQKKRNIVVEREVIFHGVDKGRGRRLCYPRFVPSRFVPRPPPSPLLSVFSRGTRPLDERLFGKREWKPFCCRVLGVIVSGRNREGDFRRNDFRGSLWCNLDERVESDNGAKGLFFRATLRWGATSLFSGWSFLN